MTTRKKRTKQKKVIMLILKVSPDNVNRHYLRLNQCSVAMTIEHDSSNISQRVDLVTVAVIVIKNRKVHPPHLVTYAS